MVKRRKINKQTDDQGVDINRFLNKILLGDCVSLMRQMPSQSVDLIFADPPYNLSKSKFNMIFPDSGGKDLNTDKGGWDKFETHDDYRIFTQLWLKEAFRILKDEGAIWVSGTYHNIYIVGTLLQEEGFTLLNEILWHKSDATPNLSCTRFVADHENFIWARKGKRNTFNYKLMKEENGGKQMRSIWTRGKTAGGKKIHPTQKPEWLLRRILLATSNENDIVLDPFMGSGTTAVVAKQLGRKYIGFEVSQEYVKKANDRVSDVLL